MGRKKGNRSGSQIERDRREITRRYLKGELQCDIAEALGIDRAIVSRELKTIQKIWQHESLFDFNEAKQKELAKIDNLELTYWDAWEDSRRDTKIVSSKTRQNSDFEQMERAESTSGDPRFLQGIQWCITKRCEIIGINAPTKMELAGNNGGAINIIINPPKKTNAE